MIFQSRHCIQPPQPTCGSPAVSWKGGREDEGGWKVADLVGARVGGYVHKSHLEHVHGGDMASPTELSALLLYFAW